MAVETFDGPAADLTTPWTQRAASAWRRNGSGLAVPTSIGAFALATYDGAGYGDPIIVTFQGDGGGDDYAGPLCFFDPATGAHYSVESNLGSSELYINYFSAVGNYVATVHSFFTNEDGIGAPNQGAGDKLEVIPSLDSGNPHFEVYYTSSGGSRLLVASFTDTTSGRPTAENFGIYAYQGAGDVSFSEAEIGGTATTYTLTAEPGALALAGVDATLRLNRLLGAESGALPVAGTDAGLLRGLRITAEPGALPLAATDASLIYGGSYTLDAEAGAVQLAATGAALLHRRRIDAEPGALPLAGGQATFTRIVNFTVGSLPLTATDADLRRVWRLVAEAGGLPLTPGDATFLHHRRLEAEPGALPLEGHDANLIYAGSYTLTAEPGALALNPGDASLGKVLRLTAEPGVLPLGGTAAVFVLPLRVLNAEPGALVLTAGSAEMEVRTVRIGIWGDRGSRAALFGARTAR